MTLNTLGFVQRLKHRNKKVNNRLALLLMVFPFVILVFMFSYIPLFGWIYAFFDYKPGIPLTKSAFVGLKYFALAVSEGSELGNIISNTLILSFLNILMSPLPVIFAISLIEVKNELFKKIIQTTTTLPYFVSWVIVFSVFYTLFSMEGQFNQLLMKIGLISEPTNVLGSNAAAWYVQTAVSVWKGLGWNSIIYIAAIAGINTELYDACKVDGAGRFRAIVHVTIPGVASTYFVLLLLGISNILSNGFDQFFMFYNAFVADKLEVLDYYVYRVGIAAGDYSYATALGISKTIISVILLFFSNSISKKIRGQSII